MFSFLSSFSNLMACSCVCIRLYVLSPTVGSNKEWKPKPTNSAVQCHGTASSSDVRTTTGEATVHQQPDVLDSREATLKPQKKLEELHISYRQHVILPEHIHVPESERTKFTFGSFGVNFGVRTSNSSGSESEKSPTPESEDSQSTEEAVEEQPSRFFTLIYFVIICSLCDSD